MTNSHREGILEVVILVLLSAVTLIVVAMVVSKGGTDPAVDPVWESNFFIFSTSTPTMSIGTEGGWWDEIDEKPQSTLPAMPDIDLLESTSTPSPATQTAIALSPTLTPTMEK
jgi:hypothetical protein